VVERYAYDDDGNRVSLQLRGSSPEALSYDGQGRLQALGETPYTLDADGFLARRGGDTFRTSARGELLGSRLAGGEVISYGYDGFGRRASRRDTEGSSQYLYGSPRLQYQVSASRDPAGLLTTYWYDDFGLLFALRRGDRWYYVATDQVGTPRLVCDAAGQVIKQLEHSTFGHLIADSNPRFPLEIGFAGGLFDAATGLVRFGLRDYDPRAGRWAARDPIGFGATDPNLYRYASNDPLTFVDPSGMEHSAATTGTSGGVVFHGPHINEDPGGLLNWGKEQWRRHGYDNDNGWSEWSNKSVCVSFGYFPLPRDPYGQSTPTNDLYLNPWGSSSKPRLGTGGVSPCYKDPGTYIPGQTPVAPGLHRDPTSGQVGPQNPYNDPGAPLIIGPKITVTF
jgi:RHS repeat-associated protein